MADTTTQEQVETNAADEAADDKAALWLEADAEEGNDAADEGRDDAQGADDSDSGGAPAGDDGRSDPGDAEQPGAKASGGTTEDQPADIWASAPPNLRDAFEATRRQLASFEHENRSNRGRIAALQRQVSELQGTAAPKGAANGEAGGKAFLESDEWKAFSDEYGEVAKPVAAAMTALESKVVTLEKQLGAIGEDRVNAAYAEQADLLATAYKHPDWREVVTSNASAFEQWLGQQPRHVQEAAQRNAQNIVDASEAADVVGRFKAYLDYSKSQGKGNGAGQSAATSESGKGSDRNSGSPSPLSGKRQRQLQSSTTTRTRGPAAATGIPADGDREQLWNMLEQAGL